MFLLGFYLDKTTATSAQTHKIFCSLCTLTSLVTHFRDWQSESSHLNAETAQGDKTYSLCWFHTDGVDVVSCWLHISCLCTFCLTPFLWRSFCCRESLRSQTVLTFDREVSINMRAQIPEHFLADVVFSSQEDMFPPALVATAVWHALHMTAAMRCDHPRPHRAYQAGI